MYLVKILSKQGHDVKYCCTFSRLPKSTRAINEPWIEIAQKLPYALQNFNFRFLSPTGDEILKDQRFDNKTCLITGATSGIGKEMTRCLSKRGCDVIIPCRNRYVAKAMAVEYNLQDRLKIYQVNLASLKSVQKCGEEILNNEKKIDMVILSAAVFGIPWTLTENGLETIFQVNFLSQYSLLKNLESILAPDVRVVFLSSESHRRVHWSAKDMISPIEQMLSIPEDSYTSIKAYNISKLCMLYAMHYLGYRWLHTKRSVFCVHPGSFIKTNLCQHWWLWEMLYTAMIPFAKTASQAAATPLYCATSPELNGLSAIFYKDCERRCESDLATDFHMAMRIMDLANEILRTRLGTIPEVKEIVRESEDTCKIKGEEGNLVF